MPDQAFIEEECRFSIRGIELAARAFLPVAHEASQSDAHQTPDQHSILTFHGWLDNANSFAKIAPALARAGFRVYCLDHAGQGLSDARPLQSSYHLWDDLVDINLIAEALGLEQFHVIGHSRGAMMASMLAASFPEKVLSLSLLDGVLPIPTEIEQTPDQMRRFVEGFSKEQGVFKTSRPFDSREQAIETRMKAASMERSAVELLAERGLREVLHNGQQAFTWHVDERLKVASAVKMTMAHNETFLQAIVCPCQIILAKQGLARLPLIEQVHQDYAGFQWHTLSGGHHQHMQGQSQAVADLLLSFLRAV